MIALPSLRKFGLHQWVSDFLIAGVVAGQGAHVTGPLHIRLTTQRVDAPTFRADVATQHLQVGNRTHIVVSGGVLSDAHRVIDGGDARGTNHLGDFDHIGRFHACDQLNFLGQVAVGHHLHNQLIKTIYPLAEISFVIPGVNDDLLHDAIEQHHIGSGALRHIQCRVIGHLDAFRVGDNQPRAVLNGLLEMRRDDRVGGRGIGADDKNDIGVGNAGDVVGHGAAAKGRLQSCDRGGMAQPRTMIDVVGPQLAAHQFLKQVVILIGRLSRGEAAQRITAMYLFNMLKTFGDQGYRFAPTGGLQFAIAPD